MAIVENFWLKDQRKKLAGAVIYQAMGQTRSRKLAETVSNPRTTSQMNQRVRWANLVNLYRANRSWMKYAFENKSQSQTDYNKFMSLNVSSSRIYLTKQQAAAGACVLDEYVFTQGSLPSIEVVKSTDNWQTNIILPAGYEMSQLTTVGEFSQGLINNNPAIREGDQLSFIKMTQMSNAVNGAPYVIVREYEMIVKSNSAALLKDYLPLDYIDSSEDDTDCRMIVKDSGLSGGFILALSRTVGGKTYVSSQRLVLANMDNYINAFSSSAQQQAAVQSYGESDEPFLSSVSAGVSENTFVPNSIVLLEINNVRYLPGQFVNITKALAGQSFALKFSSPIEGTVSSIYLESFKGNDSKILNILNPEIVSGYIEGEMPAVASLPEDHALLNVRAMVNNILYQATFAIPNEYTIVGYE